MFIPRPFRSFAFVTFEDSDVAASLMGKELVIQGCEVTIGSAVPKLPQNKQLQHAQMESSTQGFQSAMSPQFWDSKFPFIPLVGGYQVFDQSPAICNTSRTGTAVLLPNMIVESRGSKGTFDFQIALFS